jgi:hypothetical protein
MLFLPKPPADRHGTPGNRRGPQFEKHWRCKSRRTVYLTALLVAESGTRRMTRRLALLCSCFLDNLCVLKLKHSKAVWSSDLSSPWWWRQRVSLKRRSTFILHGSTSQKTNLNFILAAVRTWNLAI